MTSALSRKTPSQKLDDLRVEFAGKAYGPRRINSRITAELSLPFYPLCNGNRVMGFCEVRIHSLDSLPGDERQYILQALELAAQRMREEMGLNP